MARIATGSIVADISGKVGDNIYSRNRQGPYVKQYVSPTQPDSASQLIARQALADAVTDWNALSDSDYIAWVAFSKRFPKPTFIDGYRPVDPRAFFIGCWMNQFYIDEATNPQPIYPKPRFLERVTLSIVAGNQMFFDNFGGTIDGDYHVIYFASARQPLTVRSINTPPLFVFKTHRYLPEFPRNWFNEYITKFGGVQPTEFERVFFKVKVIHEPSGVCVGEAWNQSIGFGGGGPYNLGNENVRANAFSANNAQTIPVTTASAGNIAGVSIYIDTSAGNILVGLYADSGGSPGARLATSVITATPAAGVFTLVNFTTPFAAAASTAYWIAFVGQSGAMFRREISPILARFSTVGGFSLPDPYGASAPGAQGPSVFVTVTP